MIINISQEKNIKEKSCLSVWDHALFLLATARIKAIFVPNEALIICKQKSL